jgi:pSer/pThr/pTyr-binding forkhead associated (FHA) protein
MRYALRRGAVTRPLVEGRLLVGRAETCEVILDDPLVSRMHAAFVVEADRLRLEDLGSRNGVRVNGEKIAGARELSVGDIVRIGGAEWTVVRAERPSGEDGTAIGAQTLVRNSTTQRIGHFGVLAALADKALALGHGDEAERILAKPLEEVMGRVRSTRPPGASGAPPGERTSVPPDAEGRNRPEVEEDVFRRAAQYSLRLAVVTGRGRWLDYLFRLHATDGRLMDATLVDELYEAVRKVQGASTGQLEAYLTVLRASGAARGPSEKFLLGRLEGVVALLR